MKDVIIITKLWNRNSIINKLNVKTVSKVIFFPLNFNENRPKKKENQSETNQVVYWLYQSGNHCNVYVCVGQPPSRRSGCKPISATVACIFVQSAWRYFFIRPINVQGNLDIVQSAFECFCLRRPQSTLLGFCFRTVSVTTFLFSGSERYDAFVSVNSTKKKGERKNWLKDEQE